MKEEEYQRLCEDFKYTAITYEDTQKLKAEVRRRMKARTSWLRLLSRLINPNKQGDI